jgi:type II secretory pathway predicted ATPase ExeA
MVCQIPEAVTEQLRADVLNYMKTRPDLGPADFTQYTTLAESTVRSWLRGDIPGGIEVQGEMRRVLAQARAGDILRPGGGNAMVLTEDVAQRVRRVAQVGTFYQTQTVRRVAELIDYCVEHSAIGVITGDFGTGKTEAVKAWRRENAGKVEAIVLEFSEFTSTDKVEFVRELCRIFGLPTVEGSQSGGRMFRALCDQLRTHPCLLIFDQCETLRPRICQVIRQIWDRTSDAGVGVVMLAAPILLQRLLSRKMVDLGALTSRIGLYVALGGVTRNEMAAIVKQEGFGDVDAAGFDLWYKACAGSMRRLMRSLDLLKARHAGKHIGEKTVAGVAAHLWGMNVIGEVSA